MGISARPLSAHWRSILPLAAALMEQVVLCLKISTGCVCEAWAKAIICSESVSGSQGADM